MGQVNNLNDPNFQQKVLDRLDKLERATPMNNAAIGRGGIEVYDGGVITITNGGLSVTGSADIIGTLIARGIITFSGTLTQTGPSTFTGDTSLNGPTHINGATDIKGTLSVEGVTTLKNDLNVTTGGKVAVGTAMILTPATDGGAVTFSTGAKLSSVSGAVQMTGSGGTSTVSAAATSAGMTSGSCTAVVFNDGTWRMGSSTNNVDALTAGQVTMTASAAAKLASGAVTVAVNADGSWSIGRTGAKIGVGASATGLSVDGYLVASGIGRFTGTTTTTTAANVYMDSVGQFFKVTSAARFKVDPQPMDLPDSLLDVPVKDWWDSEQVERGEAERRVPGVIAEEVEAAGGEAFVTYDEDGTIQGVAYDRYALARTGVLARRLDEAESRIAELGSKVDALLAIVGELRAAAA